MSLNFGPIRRRKLKATIALSTAVATILGATAVDAAEVRFTNFPSATPITLENNSTVNITSAGDLEVRCVPNQANTGCVGTGGSGAAAGAPTLLLERTDSNTQLVSGALPVTMRWTVSANLAESCTGRSTPAVSGWDGAKALPTALGSGGAQTQGLSLTANSTTAATDYQLRMECYGDGGSSTEQSVAISVPANVGGGDPPSGSENCTGITGAQVKPAGFTGSEVTWDYAFAAAFPGLAASTVPLGSRSLRATFSAFPSSDPPMTGRWFAIPITFNNNTPAFTLNFANPTSTITNFPGGSFLPRHTNTMLATISTCKGDFRDRDPNAVAGAIGSNSCRLADTSGTLGLTTQTDLGAVACVLTPGTQYYLNVEFSPLASPTTNPCTNGASACDIGVVKLGL